MTNNASRGAGLRPALGNAMTREIERVKWPVSVDLARRRIARP